MYSLGVDEVDYSLYPKREHQLKWIAVYLEEAAKLRGKVYYEQILPSTTLYWLYIQLILKYDSK